METVELEIEGFAKEFPDLAATANGIAYSTTGVRAYFVTLRPEMAKRILDFNTDNYRKVRPKHVDLLSKEMRAGEFLLNGDPIRLSPTKVLDGQHRLLSLANQDSFTELEFLIVDTLPDNVIKTINANALARSYVDHLRRKGFNNPVPRCAVTVLYHKWLNDRQLDSSYGLSIADLDKVHDPYAKQITWAVANSASLSRKIKGLTPALGTLAFLILGDISQIAIKSLFIGAAEGENIRRGMPAYTMRKRFLDDHDDRTKRLKCDQMWFIFKCFDVQYKNTLRHDSDQLTIERLLPLPLEGISTSDLKKMLERG